MNGLTKLSKASAIQFVKHVHIPESELTQFLVSIKNAQQSVNDESANNASVSGTTPVTKADS